MPYKHGKFGRSSTGSKPPADKPMQSKPKGEESQTPHGDSGQKHVTVTHPGKTQPHPATGVHAFHANHMGGGKYESHTHHDGGDVETKQHENHADMMAAMNQALPDDQQGEQMPMHDDMHGDMADSMAGGIGGAQV